VTTEAVAALLHPPQVAPAKPTDKEPSARAQDSPIFHQAARMRNH
jgi:hypothetical protein